MKKWSLYVMNQSFIFPERIPGNMNGLVISLHYQFFRSDKI